MKEKVLLAFSGGLDTSFCAMYLAKEKVMRCIRRLQILAVFLLKN